MCCATHTACEATQDMLIQLRSMLRTHCGDWRMFTFSCRPSMPFSVRRSRFLSRSPSSRFLSRSPSSRFLSRSPSSRFLSRSPSSRSRLRSLSLGSLSLSLSRSLSGLCRLDKDQLHSMQAVFCDQN